MPTDLLKLELSREKLARAAAAAAAAKAAAAAAAAAYEEELAAHAAWQAARRDAGAAAPPPTLPVTREDALGAPSRRDCCGLLSASRRRTAGQFLVAATLLALGILDLDVPLSASSFVRGVAEVSSGARRAVSPSASAASRAREDDEDEWCGPHLSACWAWKHDRALQALAPVIVLVGNEAYQQLPTVGYGGIETSVDNTARALHQLGVDFFAVVPRITQLAAEPLPFRVLETPNFAAQSGLDKWAFVAEVKGVLAREMEESGRPLVIWGQSDWSQDFSEAGLVAITSHHDGGGPPNPSWNRNMPTVRHRFLCRDQQSRWMRPGDPVAALSRVIPHGLNGGDFRLCESKGYFLWVAGLGWGWEGKGLDIFLRAAEMRPQHEFLAFGSGDDGIANRLRGEAKRLPNFRFGGPLLRGENHTLAFCRAAAFFMPTHASLGESFGLTIIESLSKGVPVIASTSGSVPEVLDMPGPGRAGTTMFGTTCEGKDMECYTGAVDAFALRTPAASATLQRAARERFDMLRVVDSLLNFTIDALRETDADRAAAGEKTVWAARARALHAPPAPLW